MSGTTFSTIQSGSLTEAASTYSVYTDASDSTSYVFELIGLDASLNLDVAASYEEALIQGALAAADGLVSIDISASKFSGMFQITIDSSDIDDLSANDVIYSVASSTFPDVSYSAASVSSGKVNSSYADQALAKDVVRHIAKCITGGYAAADIFSNESDLLSDVQDHDASFSAAFSTILGNAGTSTAPASTDVLSTAKNLLAVTLGVSARSETLFADISNATQTDGAITVPVKFVTGDKLIVRINYSSSTVSHPGENDVTDRSYKVVLNLVAD